MAVLRRFKLTNVCQHRAMEHHLDVGLVAILGPNGSGKSNLANMIRTSITNDFTALAGVKGDRVSWDISTGEPSYVETEWDVDAGTMVVRRALANIGSGLWLNGEFMAESETGVTSEALKLLGVPKKIFDNFLFVNFWQLTEIAAGTKESRASLIQSLCSLDHLPKVDTKLRETIAGDKASIAAFDQAELDSLRLAFQSRKTAIRGYRQKIEDIDSQRLTADVVVEYRTAVATAKQYEDCRQNVEAAQDRLRSAKLRSRELQQQVDTLTLESVDRGHTLTNLRELYDSSEAEHTAYAAHMLYASQLAEQQAVLQIPEPLVPADPAEDLVKASADIATAKDEAERVKSLLKQVAAKANITCRECFSRIEVTEEFIASLKSLEAAALKRQAAATASAAALRVLATEYRTQSAARTTWQANRVNADKAIAKLVKPDGKAVKPKSDLASLRVKRDQAIAAFNASESDRDAAKSKLALAALRVTASQDELARWQASLPKAAPVAAGDSIAAYTTLLAEQDRLDEERRDVELSLTSDLKLCADGVKRIRRMAADRRKLRSLAGWIDVQTRARDVLRRDRLPLRVISGMLMKTASRLNYYLSKLGAAFRVSADPEQFSFQVHYDSGHDAPASSLSTGQSLCLGIAFWLARADVFAGQLPLFVFDEPTANLDAEHVLAAADMFASLSNDLIASRRQGIVITHHEAVAHAAAQVITL
jgi:DNA repair exonuclease SbcCD ATPase subunit